MKCPPIFSGILPVLFAGTISPDRPVDPVTIGHSQPSRRRLAATPRNATRVYQAMLARRARADVGPQLIKLLLAEHATPRRHLSAPVKDRLVEARSIARAELPEIRHDAGAPELLAVAAGTMLIVERLAGLRLVLR